MFIVISFVILIIILTNSHQQTISNSVNVTVSNTDASIQEIQINDLVMCQSVNTDKCSELVTQMLQCQEIIFYDPGFSYQQYRKNIQIHREMLRKHRVKCSGRSFLLLLFDEF